MKIKDYQYNFIAHYEDGRDVLFSKAEKTDAKRIVELYTSIQISASNYMQKFDSQHPRNFSKTGGMFYVLDEASFLAELEETDSTFLVARNENGIIIGFLWASIRDPSFKVLDFQKLPENPELIFSLREIVVMPECGYSNLPYLLNYIIFLTFYYYGYRFSLCEIYHLKSYTLSDRDSDADIDIDMLNISAIAAEKSCGKYIIDLPDKHCPIHELESSDVTIKSRMYFWELDETLSYLQSVLEAKGISVNRIEKE
jgi:hypothetical protein